ncbi:hypothetical protein KIN20_020019 [Parelaphostrongylus tenuis]|uniref:Uncharacterized protein n=1 Tax=Parelaphostrongylus tenuis TaxID=148309 RepID=A0AAD5MQG9_PARTN|nr:hypothetical protein KIN20_020019 [Parelaphostrongylus tenuis]
MAGKLRDQNGVFGSNINLKGTHHHEQAEVNFTTLVLDHYQGSRATPFMHATAGGQYYGTYDARYGHQHFYHGVPQMPFTHISQFAADTTPLSVGLSSPVETAIAREPPQGQGGTRYLRAVPSHPSLIDDRHDLPEHDRADRHELPCTNDTGHFGTTRDQFEKGEAEESSHLPGDSLYSIGLGITAAKV